MEWISVEDELPPHGWPITVKNGKCIFYRVKYRCNKWNHCGRKLRQVTHWKYAEDRKPSIPTKDMRDYLQRAEKYRDQMQKRKFTLRQAFL